MTEHLIALAMLTGIIQNLQVYWLTDPKQATPFFNSIMSRDKLMNPLSTLKITRLSPMNAYTRSSQSIS